MSKINKNDKNLSVGTINEICSMLFECEGGVWIQVSDERFMSVWLDGDTSKPPHVEFEFQLLNQIMRAAKERFGSENANCEDF